MRRLLSTAAASLILMTASIAGAASPVSAEPQYFWKWSDGSRDGSRTFSADDYPDAAALPRLIVTQVPARPGHDIDLRFARRGEWVLESRVHTDRHGVAAVSLNPYCDSDAWCDRTFAYRLTAGPRDQRIRVTYSAAGPSRIP